MKDLLINEEIRDKEVRLVGTDGEQLGIVSISVAQNMAIEKNMDLVKIAPQAVPPVCKIMDYGKFKFEQAKREKEAKKNQKVIEIKEVRLSLNIDTNDFNTKVNRAIKFLEAGDKVKAALRFRGREMAHPELGVNIMQRFTDAVAAVGVVEKQPKMEGRSMVMFVSPKPVTNTKGGK
ncbi:MULTISPECIES: translation initiation factor IF-3 [unclassified Anaerotruncus]|jgi:translation initiation factor IF-3|uniref:translation initiation factor IF-3 n=1 Tax=unclassified Anaerotruncus TaxID=2641626 RepID=UPI00033550DF|nr:MULTISPECIES: translation initiation factor IF-3 [unclassified Anaerotruncus]MCI9159646.1 translation initiation factor IF-3 [Anaerotruncus sp.]NCE73727.1 translation initiation factor IF-3 [Anaerotruncus sp. X29]RKJ93661.1 translation initiation factor IF-3 [Anaerotruncus sp. 1XD22-93]EOS61593.1 translation initiation factor IF-3 [Anaerotruncus sp. G3(2012)]MCI9234626.1 translation initiation factor IF-3 [Anaerotruncus sp.]